MELVDKSSTFENILGTTPVNLVVAADKAFGWKAEGGIMDCARIITRNRTIRPSFRTDDALQNRPDRDFTLLLYRRGAAANLRRIARGGGRDQRAAGQGRRDVDHPAGQSEGCGDGDGFQKLFHWTALLWPGLRAELAAFFDLISMNFSACISARGKYSLENTFHALSQATHTTRVDFL